ncbi:MAG: response regulator [Synergistaceae bacterium]|nr:response regulator [Synergistaceae bacterium]
MNETKANSVLIVDDEVLNIMILRHILSPEYTVYVAKSGHSAISAAEMYLPDVILLDIVMPDIDGYDVITALKKSEKTQNIPVIFVTSLTGAGNEEKGLVLGASDYIARPFNPMVVKLRVQNQIKIQNQLRALKEFDSDLMKYILASDALQMGLWDMDVVLDDPLNPNNIMVFSPEYRNMIGYSDERDFPNLVRSWVDGLHPEDKERTINAGGAHLFDFTGQTPYDVEYRFRQKNGEYRYNRAFGRSHRNSEGVPLRVAGAIMDIHEKKQMEHEIRRAEIAEESNKAKSKFLAMMSHEIRTPMNAILGMTELALRESEPDVKNEHILTVKQAGTDLLAIINDILDFSKIEAGKLEIVPGDYSFPSLINDVIRIVKMRVDSRIRLTSDIDGSIPKTLFGDETKIRQALLNILNNAVKYTEKGFVSFTVHGRFVDEDVVELVMEVADSGKGIKREDMEKLFSDFTQFDLEKNKGIEGTGLGLAITHRIVKAMGGSIGVESEYGKGSKFTITLPQKYHERETHGSEAPAAAETPDDSKGIITADSAATFTAPDAKILVVDDILTNLKVARGLLSPYKVQITPCKSGMTAIEAIQSKDYDLVFMDHMMPEMDGVEATRRIRKMGAEDPYYKNVPIVALTANAVSGTREMFLENGFDDFLSKPIDTDKLNSILETWVPKSKQERIR